MSISPGTRLGPYEILGPLGTGGMGEVYKAKDTRLDRTVAVKVLSGAMAADSEFRARFEREARTISQLNHPHICVLHDVGRFRAEDASASQVQAVERDYLVMEYLEGKTLAERLEQGPLPLDQALKLATEIADALDKAHRQGVVHRDLKPGNVMLTKAGAKLLDFGLAKPGGAASPGGETQLVASPAQAPLTARGTILGTFQYMAPEQLESKDADARSDVWAFGCVLYEMLTGKRAFEGASQASLIGAILNHQPPPVSSLQSTSPPMLDRVVRTCLAKDPDDRWQTVHDLSSELKWIAQPSPAGGAAVTPHITPRQILQRTGVIAASVVAGAALAALWFSQNEPRASAPVPVRAMAPLPSGMEIVVGARKPMTLSPDGKLLAFSATSADGLQIFIRPLDRFEATALAGTQGGSGPFFSPKGDWLGFFVASEGRLKKVALSGGAPVVISEAPDVRGASWAPDDAIVYTGQLDGGLLRIAPGSRTPEELTKPDASRREKTHRFPNVLPNGKGVIFTIGAHDVTSFSDAKIAVYDFATRQTTVLIEGGSDANYLPPGYLVYGRSGALMAVRFDAERLVVSGTPVPMIDGALTSGVFGPAHFAAAPTGVLAYIPGTEPLDVNQLLIATRDGQATAIGERRYILAARASPSGDRATVRIGGANDTLWIQDLRHGGALSRITFRGNVSGAVWTPNSQRIIYNIGNEIASIAADGSGDDRTIFQDQYTGIPTSITPDGKTLLYQTNRPATGWDIWALSIEEGKARPVLSAPFTERFARLSPDGRWIAYTSNESNRDEVYVRPYPALGSRALVSRDGGSYPVWSEDGRELFFRRGSAVYVVKVIVTGVNFDSGAPVKLPTPQPLNVAVDSMDYLPGGRLLLIQGTPRPLPTSLNIVTGWLGELAARVPIK